MKMLNLSLVTNHKPQKIQRNGHKEAAVLVPVIQKDNNEYRVLFTVRAKGLKEYSQMVSFPGGRFEPDDENLLETALRETQEEIGISPKWIKVIGQLDDFESSMGHVVTPYVGIISSDDYKDSIKCSHEVEEVFTVSVENLLDPHIKEYSRNGKTFPMYSYPVNGVNIWGLTGSILTQFIDISTNRNPRRVVKRRFEG